MPVSLRRRTFRFQSTYLYKVRRILTIPRITYWRFNPRTYIRYDFDFAPCRTNKNRFQSTYLYKVRLAMSVRALSLTMFQSTYLYKVRHKDYGKVYFEQVSIHVPI